MTRLIQQASPVQLGLLERIAVPFTHIFIGPFHLLVCVTEQTGDITFECLAHPWQGGTHGVVGAIHVRKRGHGHVTGDADWGVCLLLMVGVRLEIVHLGLMAGQARAHGGVRLFEAIATTGGMAVHAVQLTGFKAAAHAPGGHGVVFAQVASVRVEVRVVQCDQIEVVEEAFARIKRGGDG